MFKMTERARKVLNLAYYEANLRQQNTITSEYILLAMLREGHSIGARVLQDAGITLHLAQEHLHFAPMQGIVSTPEHHFWRRWSVRLGLRHGPDSWDALGLSADARICIEQAAIAAQRLGHRFIGTEHILLGLLESSGGAMMLFLRGRGIDRERVEHAMLKQRVG